MMNDTIVNFKKILCFFGLIQLGQCKYHFRPDDTRVPMKPRPYVRHNTMYDITSTVAHTESLGPNNELEPTLEPDGEDAQDLDMDESGQDEAGDKASDGLGDDVQPTPVPGIETELTFGPNDIEEDYGERNNKSSPGRPSDAAASKDFCWFAINTIEHFREMDELDEKHSGARLENKNSMGSSNFDEEMLKKLLASRSVADRALQNFGGEANMVPSGLDLGGDAMMRMPQSVLFFNRLKLRNNTRFTINYLHNDLQEMTLTARISMHDMHLVGNYERALTMDREPSTLFYRPTSGDVEFLLRDVEYAMEGRYRLMLDRLSIVHVISEIKPKEILMKFAAEPNKDPYKLELFNVQDYMLRMQNDLDSWVRDYFNDFLIYFSLAVAEPSSDFQLYENEKTIALNRFADEVVTQTRRRLRRLNASTVKIPSFNLFAINGLEIKLSQGIVRGLDSMYRRSVATGKRKGDVRFVDAVVAFSNLKVQYHYEAFVKTGLPPLFGTLVLTADELAAHMAISVVQAKHGLDLDFKLLKEPKSQSLTVEGSANRIIGNFKHLLEHHIIAIMSNSLTNVLGKLGTLTRCYPNLYGAEDPNYKHINSNEAEDENK